MTKERREMLEDAIEAGLEYALKNLI